MAQITYRANLSAKDFPFLSEQSARTVMVGGPDQTYNRQLSATVTDEQKDVGVAQAYYMHNVMPTSEGYQSIGYRQLVQATAIDTFTNVQVIRDGGNNKAILAHMPNGDNWVLLNSSNGWMQINNTGTGITTAAYVGGITYIYVANIGCFTYNFGTNNLDAQALAGLTATDILGLTTAAGYLLAYSANAVAWSSTIDATDFTPSLTTGAGGGSVDGAQGAITACAPAIFGFIVYTAANAVSAVYSGNARYPFIFKALVGGGGCSSLNLIVFDSATSYHYAYTTSGLQLISSIQSATVFPDVTDFISGLKFEDFNESTLVWTELDLTTTMQKKLAVVSDRYLVISYGITEFTHAIIYDTVLKRWGKIKHTHVDCFEYELLSTLIIETPRQSLAFVDKTGLVTNVDFSFGSSTTYGVVLLGKYQYVRQRLLDLEQVDIENSGDPNLIVYALPSLDGKNPLAYIPMMCTYQLGLFKRYNCDLSGLNHSILFVGGFNLLSIELAFAPGARP